MSVEAVNGVLKNRGHHFVGPYTKDCSNIEPKLLQCSISGSIVGSLVCGNCHRIQFFNLISMFFSL